MFLFRIAVRGFCLWLFQLPPWITGLIPGRIAGLTQGSDGVFYGTTYRGGSNDAGTVFKLNPNGTGYTLLHNFLTNGVDGQNPAVGGNLLLGRNGVLIRNDR